MEKGGQLIGIKDKNGNEIFVGAVIKHNDNLYVIKWYKIQKQFVARKEPLKGQTMSWRDSKWIERLSDKYIEIVGAVLFDDEVMKNKFKGVY